MPIYEYLVPFHGTGFVRIEAKDLQEADERLLNEKPPFDDEIYHDIEWRNSTMERLDDAKRHD